LAKLENDITLDEVQKIVQEKSAWKIVNSLIDKKLVSVYENLYENYKPKKENFVFLTVQYQQEDQLKTLFEILEKAPKQLHLLLTYLHLVKTEKNVLQADLLKHANASQPQLKALCEKGVFEVKKLEVDRLQTEYKGELIENVLSKIQQKAYEEIQSGFAEKKPVLLKGITGSGKTHIYFQLIKDCIQQGKQALYLLPEIALTTQIIRKLRATFGDKIGIYHSRFSNNERVEVWQKIQHQQYDVVIGARSALLLPFANLGLIIVDEEHDTSYKQQDPAPRYHARDSAIYLAYQSEANIVLGSATPSVESYYNAKQNKYKLVELGARFGEGKLPPIHFIDAKKEQVEKRMKGIFSQTLIDEIQKTIQAKKQVILFQNRRGYSPFLQCTTCGWVPQCKYCDVSLTYHKVTDQLHCHYCGSKSPVIKICLACGGNRILAKSFGTEKIEEEIKQQFPNARVQRFDWDAMRTKNKYQEIIRQFEKQEIDILVGTQMVVKGLDFEHVNLVGVLSADSLLSYPDFRVNERVFQLLEQVSGRAGRKDGDGNVFIQAYKVNNPTLLKVQEHDFENFFLKELEGRKDFQYPPYTRIIKITLKHRDQKTVLDAAQKLGLDLAELPKTILFGPAEPPIARVRNLFIQEILLKINRDSDHVKQIKSTLKEKISMLNITKNFSTVNVQVDVDPF
jgi:primosomal protein N' (replication factor Y)